MKKWLKSNAYGSVNSTRMHCLQLKSHQNRLKKKKKSCWKRKRKTQKLNPNLALIEDIKCNVNLFNQLLYSHVKREGNIVAHNLVRHSISISNFAVWMETIPPPFISLVLVDI